MNAGFVWGTAVTLIETVRSSRVSEPLLEYPPVPPQAYLSSALNP